MDPSRKYFVPFFVAVIVFGILFLITNQNTVQKIGWIWLIILPIFVLFYLYSLFNKKLKSWQLPVSSAVILLLGLYLLVVSRFPSYTTKLTETWDINTASLGIALVAFAFIFTPLTSNERTAVQNPPPTDTADEISRLTAEIESLNNRLIALKKVTEKLNSILSDPPHTP
jgi:energy-coupling factor transporter transmembrane protein EcfT